MSQNEAMIPSRELGSRISKRYLRYPLCRSEITVSSSVLADWLLLLYVSRFILPAIPVSIDCIGSVINRARVPKRISMNHLFSKLTGLDDIVTDRFWRNSVRERRF